MAEPTEPDRCAPGSRAHRGERSTLLLHTRQTLRATAIFAEALDDRIAFALATDAGLLDNVPSDHLVQLIAVSDAFQDGACSTLFLIEPELARNARTIARMVRDAVVSR